MKKIIQIAIILLGWFIISIWITSALNNWKIWDLFTHITAQLENWFYVTWYRLEWTNILDESVTSDEIMDWEIKESDIADLAVTNNKIWLLSVTENKLSIDLLNKINSPWLVVNSNNYVPISDWTGLIDSVIYENWTLIWINTTTPSAELEVNWNIITDLPTANNHAATKEYVDNRISASTASFWDNVHEWRYFSVWWWPNYCKLRRVDSWGWSYTSNVNQYEQCWVDSVCISWQCTLMQEIRYISYPKRSWKYIYTTSSTAKQYCSELLWEPYSRINVYYTTHTTSYQVQKYTTYDWWEQLYPSYPWIDWLLCSVMKP